MPEPAPNVELRSVATPAAVAEGRLRGLVPYSVESRDLGGFTEVIDAGALDGADFSELICTREHDRSQLLGRYPSTLSVELTPAGLAWAAELPDTPTGVEVRSAVERGDLRASSWGMVVAKDYYVGAVRHIAKIAALVDVCVTAVPVYKTAEATYRSVPAVTTTNEVTMPDVAPDAVAEATAPVTEPAPTLTVETRAAEPAAKPPVGLAAEFRAAGFPAAPASIEFRAAAFTGSNDLLSPVRREGVELGADQRYVWPMVPQVPVGAGDTAVQILRQTVRTLPTTSGP
jgi:HK97 family phage prohead protease